MTTIPTGRFVWFEYLSGDAKKAQGFYGELFNWGTKDVPMPDGAYTMIAVGDRTIGGYSKGDGARAAWMSHLQVANAKETAAKVASLGGKVVQDAFKVGDFGQMAIVTDPDGAAFALWQPVKAEESPAPTTGSFVWNELFAVDADAAVKFYQAIGGFGHDSMDMGPMGTYHLLTAGDAPRAGIMKKSPEQPHAWLPYVQVANADATADKAKKLKATIIVPPSDIPNVGRFAILADPQGAPIGILQPAPR
jgi:uncharacterized protein